MRQKTIFSKLKMGDRFQIDGIGGTYSKTSEKDAWSPNGRFIPSPDSVVWKETIEEKKGTQNE